MSQDQKSSIVFYDFNLPNGFVLSGVKSGFDWWMQITTFLGELPKQIPDGVEIPNSNFRLVLPGKKVYVPGNATEVLWMYWALTEGKEEAGEMPAYRTNPRPCVGYLDAQGKKKRVSEGNWHSVFAEAKNCMIMYEALFAKHNGASGTDGSEEGIGTGPRSEEPIAGSEETFVIDDGSEAAEEAEPKVTEEAEALEEESEEPEPVAEGEAVAEAADAEAKTEEPKKGIKK